MAKEQHGDHESVRAIMILLVGMAGGGLGFTSAFAFDTGGGCSTFGYAFLGFLIGLVAGFLLGIPLAWSINVNPVDPTGRTESDGPQLVGQNCVICGKAITSILEGEFCRDCRSPVHDSCVIEPLDRDPQKCPRCGADPLP